MLESVRALLSEEQDALADEMQDWIDQCSPPNDFGADGSDEELARRVDGWRANPWERRSPPFMNAQSFGVIGDHLFARGGADVEKLSSGRDLPNCSWLASLWRSAGSLAIR